MTKADMMSEMAYIKSPNYMTQPPAEAQGGVEDHSVASPGEDPKPPHTPALCWLADREAVATQEWQDGFNVAYSYYAQQPVGVGSLASWMINNLLTESQLSVVPPGQQKALRYFAQQPAADGGFTAADMMDARQEGRKEAQQPAAVDGVMVERMVEAFLASTGQQHSVTQLQRDLTTECMKAALAAQPKGDNHD